jgi:formate dehydrogenase beta subunit
MKTLTINGKTVTAEDGATILDAALGAGMVVQTDTEHIQELRRTLAWLLISDCPGARTKDSQLTKVLERTGVDELIDNYKPVSRELGGVRDHGLFTMDPDLCILCGRCVRMCQQVRGVGAIGIVGRGAKSTIGTAMDKTLEDSACRFCTACVEVCPTGALRDKVCFEACDREDKLVPCVSNCPAGIDVPRYVQLIAEGRFQDALDVIREKVPFPLSLGYICPHTCETACRRGDVNEAVAIRELKRFVAEKGNSSPALKPGPPTGRRVAVVGAGPAGLTCASYLALAGHAVTVYEADSEPGGMMRKGIPRYRLPKAVLEREIDDLRRIGIDIRTNTRIESMDGLFDGGAHAVFLSTGAPAGMMMGIAGENNPRVFDGITFLESQAERGITHMAGTAAVVGGGNTAIDVARTCVRLGADKVVILYRRTREDMPAEKEEMDYAIEEGVDIVTLVMPVEIVPRENGLAVECIRMKQGEPGPDGRRRPLPIEGSEFTVEANALVMAIGQKPDIPDSWELATDKRGRPEIDPDSLMCSRNGVFAGGDLVTGPATVVKAIAAGRNAAAAIDRYLGGSGDVVPKLVPEEPRNSRLGREEGFARRERLPTPVVPVAERVRDFAEVEHTFYAAAAEKEAGRCLRCRLRLDIAPAPLPPPGK